MLMQHSFSMLHAQIDTPDSGAAVHMRCHLLVFHAKNLPNRWAQVVMRQACVLEVPGSHLNRDTNCPLGFGAISQYFFK